MIHQITQNFKLSRLNNAEYTGLLLNLQKVMQELDTEQLGIDHEMASEYNRLLNQLTDQVYSTTGSQYTAAMQAADVKRSRLFKKIRLKLQAVDVAEEGSSLLPIVGVVNTYLLSKYGTGIVKLAQQERSAILTGFVYDLRDKLTSGQQKELAITDDIDSLEAANDEFVTAYNQRVTERAGGEKDVTNKLRTQLLDIYRLICIQTQYTANFTPAEGHEEATAVCQQFIALLNQLLNDAKSRLDQRKRKGDESDNENEDGEGPGAGGGASDEPVEV